MDACMLKQLKELSDEKYRQFMQKLLPPDQQLLGVPLPKLRRLAGELRIAEGEKALCREWGDTFEERMLQGMLIGASSGTWKEVEHRISAFLPRIQNWSLCDSFCAGLKIAKVYSEEMWRYLQTCLKKEEEYTVRFALVMELNYYLEENRVADILNGLEELYQKDVAQPRYVQLAAAWLLAEMYIRFPIPVQCYFENNSLDEFTQRKSLQKIRESQRVNAAQKEKLKKRKTKKNT